MTTRATRSLARLVAVVAGGVLLSSAVTAPAHAWKEVPLMSGETTGQVSVDGTFQTVTDRLECTGGVIPLPGACAVRARLSTPAFTIGAVPMSPGEQKVLVSRYVQARQAPGQPWTTFERSVAEMGSVASGSTYTTRPWTSRNSYQPTSGAVEYRVRVVVGWVDAATTYLLGQADYVPSALSDTAVAGAGATVVVPTSNGFAMSYVADALAP